MLEEPEKYIKFQFENITVTKAPLLKIYYWECCNIEGLNNQLKTQKSIIEHSFWYPTCQINSKPLKIIFWIRNCSNQKIQLNLSRIKNCSCEPLETRVGFNQFRQLYHCPHRRLIHILQDFMSLEPDDLVAMDVTTYFFLFGEHRLTYQIKISDTRQLNLHFNLDIVGFDPQKCILTKELIPTYIREFRRFVQPIWVRNITLQHMNFHFSSRDRGFRLLNPTLTVPRQSVWPLMIEYRPSDLLNEMELSMNYENVRTKFPITCRGIIEDEDIEPNVPLIDYDCVDFPYTVYPNKLNVYMKTFEERNYMLSIHNYNNKCVEFHWQNYIINELFEITFEPENFRLKPHHSLLCIVNVKVHNRPLHFKRIPMVLEVHRIFDKSTKLAKSLLEEVESIDNPKWKLDSYMEHVFLQLNLKVTYRDFDVVKVRHHQHDLKTDHSLVIFNGEITIFEKLYWKFLQKSTHMRESKNYPLTDEFSFEEVLNPPQEFRDNQIDKNRILRMISQLIADGLRDLGKNWIFIPKEYAEQIV